MKKTWKKLLISALSLVFVFTGLVACSDNYWNPSSVTLKDGGAVVDVEMNGFITETENYVYFINGIGTSSADNTFGAPVKGSLIAADKANLSNSCVVVPKLFVASDYKAGVYIYDGYVYYGSPSTDKNPDGDIAYTEMTFAKTKLDGTGTETFFSVDSLSTEYRFVKGADDSVYLIYYKTDDTALVAYNTATKSETVIAKTTNEAEKESLNAYKFATDGTIVYTVTVYKDKYNESEKENQGDSYSRTTEGYNKVYAYKIGDTGDGECKGSLVLNGEGTLAKTYTLSLINGKYVFYTYTDGTSNAVTQTGYFTTDALNACDVKNTAYAVEDALIVSADEIYLVEDTSYLVKGNLNGNLGETKQTVAKCSTFGKLLFVDGEFMYYINSNNNLARIYIRVDEEGKTEKDLMEQRVSEDTVATDWYAPELIDGKVFYVDNSTEGASYVKYVSVNATVETEADDDGEITLCYLTGNEFVGKITGEDKASMVTAEINGLSSVLEDGRMVFDTDDDGNIVLDENNEPQVKAVKDARASYEALGDDKKHVSDSTLELLEKYEEALRLNRIFYKLDGFDTASDKDSFRDAYDAAAKEISALESSDKYDDEEMRDMFATNLNYFYQEADKYFNPTEEEK